MYSIRKYIANLITPSKKKEDLIPLIRQIQESGNQREQRRVELINEVIVSCDTIRQGIAAAYHVAIDSITLTEQRDTSETIVGSVSFIYRHVTVKLTLETSEQLTEPYVWRLTVQVNQDHNGGYQRRAGSPVFSNEVQSAGKNDATYSGSISNINDLQAVVEEAFTVWVCNNPKLIEQMGNASAE